MRIIFMGTPDFAVASLDALVQSGENIVAVVTAPDKPAGRGQKLHQSAVKIYAEAHGIPVLQPVKLRDPDFLEELRIYQADLQVVVAFRMLPEAVWNMPPYGTINVHASLLPQYRGAAPINHAIINGEHVSGVSTFLLQHEIDTGKILLSEEVAIAPDDNAGILHDKLMHVGAQLLLKTLAGLKTNTLTPKAQSTLIPESELKHAPKIFKENCQIDWNQDIDTIYNLIRGLSPYPAAYTSLDNKVLKLYVGTKEYSTPDITPGDYKTDGKSYLKFAGNNGYIHVIQLQIEGKKKMEIIDFLRGYRF
ncbi:MULTISPECIES: methionyl-tRNA formyltransferase [Sphingobacterium]|jgi:methionyl-tRNA formyltransferase|uniref:methionyl-tRNA formyltransferase n=1 Tax=Sphingobacterium TaxID=28453 RepID=UPI000B9A8B2E|nr:MULTISPECIES: methionyl-tRNA formyltransferase [Sphingobacterium]UPZ36070.1 methionyl-tRNA formyltransferase [Sphingobacterium sp. PCS056]UXD71604.1 methionyl-tRNA formyltransferase [Sphingobacterium faecium]WGQ15260.1 methionyl-tRNA formyltransferase [Sphingobacterium faecium]